MRKFFIILFLFSVFNVYRESSYAQDNTQRMRSQTQEIQRQQTRNQNQNRPILPPVASPSSSVSPTISPHISVPSLQNDPMNMPSSAGISQFGNSTVRNIPSSPASVTMPGMAGATELPQVPIIGNSIGKVTDKGIGEDGSPWIEVKDDIFDEILKIKINPKSTPVIEKTTVRSYADIKIGDTVSVIFNETNGEAMANFVSILTEEDIKAMEEALTQQEPEELKETETE